MTKPDPITSAMQELRNYWYSFVHNMNEANYKGFWHKRGCRRVCGTGGCTCDLKANEKAVCKILEGLVNMSVKKILKILDKAELEDWFDMVDSTENWRTWKRIRNTIRG